jgi:hypothetical protein
MQYFGLTALIWSFGFLITSMMESARVLPNALFTGYLTFVPQYALVAWGLPAVVAIVTVGAGSTYAITDKSCFLSLTHPIGAAFLAPLGICLCGVIICFCFFLRSTCKQNIVTKDSDSLIPWGSFGSAMLLFCLYGCAIASIAQESSVGRIIICMLSLLHAVSALMFPCHPAVSFCHMHAHCFSSSLALTPSGSALLLHVRLPR